MMDELPEKATVVTVDDLRGARELPDISWRSECGSSRRVVTAGKSLFATLLTPLDEIGTLLGRLLYHVDTLESFHMRLQKETTPHPQGTFAVLLAARVSKM